MGSCFKNIFNRKKETYYFVNPYSPQEGKYQTKDDVKYEYPTNSDVIRDTKIKTAKAEDRKIEATRVEASRIEENNVENSRIEATATPAKIEATQASPVPPQDDDVVDFMDSTNDIRDDLREVRDDIKDEVDERRSLNDAHRTEDINENSIHTKREEFYDEAVEVSEEEVHRSHQEPVQLQVNDEPWQEDDVHGRHHAEEAHTAQEDHHSSQDDVTAEEDLTAAIAEVVEEAKGLSTESLQFETESTDDSKRSSKQEEIIREDVMAVEAHPNEAVSADSVNITVVQADYVSSSPRDRSPSRSSTRSEEPHDDDFTEAPRAFQDAHDGDSDDGTRITKTVEEMRETGEDGDVTVITVTTTEITRSSEFTHHEDDEDDDTREPTIALLNKNSAQIQHHEEHSDEDGELNHRTTTTNVMVNGEGVDDLPRELRDLDAPPSPTSVVHINTPFPVDQ